MMIQITLWGCEQTGRITCSDSRCTGGYLAAAIEAQPRAKRHRTPLNMWVKIEGAELFETYAFCEECEIRKMPAITQTGVTA